MDHYGLLHSVIHAQSFYIASHHPFLLHKKAESGLVGGSASGRVAPIFLSVLGLNPGMDLCFIRFRIAVILLLLGVGPFLKNVQKNVGYSCYSFPVSYHLLPLKKYSNCNLTMYHEKEKHKYKKRLEKSISKPSKSIVSINLVVEARGGMV